MLRVRGVLSTWPVAGGNEVDLPWPTKSMIKTFDTHESESEVVLFRNTPSRAK